jgi:hypothetical protein
VRPCLSVIDASAPLSRRIITISEYPFSDARINDVLPLSSFASTLALLLIRSLAMSVIAFPYSIK